MTINILLTPQLIASFKSHLQQKEAHNCLESPRNRQIYGRSYFLEATTSLLALHTILVLVGERVSMKRPTNGYE